MNATMKERFSIIGNKTWLSLSSILKSKSIMILLIIFPMFSIIVPVFFAPFWSSAAYVVQVNVITTTGLIYGTIVFGYKKSTLNNNEKLLTKSRSSSYLSALIVISIFIFVSSGIQLIIIFFLNWTHLLLPDWILSAEFNDRGYDLTQVKYLGWFWSIFWTMMITFGIFFALRNVIKNQKGHYIIVLSMLIIAFIWGGTLNDYFTSVCYIESTGQYERSMSRGLFPDSLYWPTIIIFPFFAPGQMASLTVDFGITRNGMILDNFSYYTQSVIHLTFAKDYLYAAEWNALILAPPAWTAFLTFIGIITGEK